VIYPGKYTYTELPPAEMASHALEDLDPRFAKGVQPGDIIVAGKNWGCGSSREQAVTCLKHAGVGALIAKSFARIYFRNAINQGLPIVQCSAVEGVESGEEVTVDFSLGKVITPRGEYSFPPLSDFVMGILEDGGLIPHVRRQLGIE
jgi:3-isopropylmalate/(R)-2-methylmalate dehydratase small subunit